MADNQMIQLREPNTNYDEVDHSEDIARMKKLALVLSSHSDKQIELAYRVWSWDKHGNTWATLEIEDFQDFLGWATTKPVEYHA